MDIEKMALKSMKKLLRSSDCNWTSNEQREAVIHALQGKKDLLVALLTGSGKSMVPMLAAMLGGGKTFLVIVPLISLLEDWECRLKSFGTRYSVLRRGIRIFPDSPIVLATIDLAIKSDLIECIGNAYARESFGGVVIDEVHDVLVSHEFWDCMRSVWQLRTLPFPVIAMSGTLPIRMEAPLISELCLQPDTIIVRKSSNRPELQYHIESALKSLTDLQKCIQKIVYSQKLSSSERGLVFVTSISDGLLLAKGLQCSIAQIIEYICLQVVVKEKECWEKS